MTRPSWRIRLTAQKCEPEQLAFFARSDSDRLPKPDPCQHRAATGEQVSFDRELVYSLQRLCEKCGEVMA